MEEIFLGHITTGAGNDIERATDIARNMVCEWGMSEPRTASRHSVQQTAVSSSVMKSASWHYSKHTAIQIDKEVRRIVNSGYDKAKALLGNHSRGARAHRAGIARARSD